MDFSAFKAVDQTNDRKPRKGGIGPRVQDYTGMKYTRGMRHDKDKKELGIDSRFFISNALWSELNLNELGLRQFEGPNGEVVIGTVADDKATMFKKSKKSETNTKSKVAKWTHLELALAKAGVIDINLLDKNQFINASVVDQNVTINGISVAKVVVLSKGDVKDREPGPMERKKLKEEQVAKAGTSEVNTGINGGEQPAPAAKVETPVTQPVAETAKPAAKSDWD